MNVSKQAPILSTRALSAPKSCPGTVTRENGPIPGEGANQQFENIERISVRVKVGNVIEVRPSPAGGSTTAKNVYVRPTSGSSSKHGSFRAIKLMRRSHRGL